ncbi:methyltransferase domain-containing protein [Alsobacter sp. R-9]
MTAAPRLFDRVLQRRRLARALAAGDEAFFLVRRAADDLADRLAAVLRRFPDAVDVGTPTAVAAEVLAAGGKVDRLLRLAPVVTVPSTTGPGCVQTVADEEVLPLAPESVDLAVSLLALQSVNDLPGTLVQIRRALRPDGLFIGCLLGGASLTELRQCFAEAESEMEGGVSPRVAPFADVRDMGGLLQRAGFALPVTDVETMTVRYADAFRLFADLRAAGATNALVERRRSPLRRATLMRAATLYAERFSDPDGRVRATVEFIWLSGWAPHESQQKPLRPGSARMRLAEALGVPEQPTGEKP